MGVFLPWITMKVLLLISVLAALTLGDQSTLQKFNDFKLKYKKTYRSINEEVERLDIFKANLAEIEAHNSGKSSYKKGINQFTDLTKEEFKQTYLGLKTFPSSLSSAEKIVKQARNRSRELPDSVNWVEAGAVTGVENQGQCGSCWAFSLTSQVESYYFIETNELLALSTQQVTSCTPNTLSCGGTGGCRGSVTQLGFNYLQLFGYGTEYGPLGTFPYWLVRNSWGANWGENGFIKMKRTAECGVNSTPMDGTACVGGPGNDEQTVCGMCGMLLDTTYPLGVSKWGN